MEKNAHYNLVARLGALDIVCFPSEVLGITWREITVNDVEQAHEVVKRAEDYDQIIMMRTDYQEVARMVKRMEETPHGAKTIVGLDEKQVRSVASVYVIDQSQEVLTAYINAWVDPIWRERGIGRALLNWQDQMARLLLCNFAWDGPVRIGNYICAKATSRMRILTAGGYNPLREFQVMVRDIRGQQLPTLYQLQRNIPTGLKLDFWNENIADKVRACHKQAFAKHWGEHNFSASEMKHILRHIEPSWSPVILNDANEVVAYLYTRRWNNSELLASIHNVDPEVSGHTMPYSEYLGVLPEYRGLKLARVCLEAAAVQAQAMGMTHLGIDVDTQHQQQAGQFYTRVGYMPVDSRETFFGITL